MKSVMLFPLSSQVKAGDVISGAKRIKRSLFQPRKGRYGKRYFTIVLLFGLARPKTNNAATTECKYFEEC